MIGFELESEDKMYLCVYFSGEMLSKSRMSLLDMLLLEIKNKGFKAEGTKVFVLLDGDKSKYIHTF